MKETLQREIFRRTGPRNRRIVLLIFAVMLFPTRSYLVQEVRFWLVVLAILVVLGVVFFATFLVLREAGHRAHQWMKTCIERIPAAKYRRLILRNTVTGEVPHR